MRSFGEIFQHHFQALRQTLGHSVHQHGCRVQLATEAKVPSVCHLCYAWGCDYLWESKTKQEAVREWAGQLRELPKEVEFVAAPTGRHYRTVSKRRWYYPGNGRCVNRVTGPTSQRPPLGFLGMPETGRKGSDRGWSVAECQIENPGHTRLFHYLEHQLPTKEVADGLNSIILKETFPPDLPAGKSGATVIFNVRHLGQNRKVYNQLSKKLTKKFGPTSEESVAVVGVWLVEGHPLDEHFLQVQGHKFVKLHGENSNFDSMNFRYSPLGFTQVHSGVSKLMADWICRHTLPGRDILDLFCGYGLLGLSACTRLDCSQPRVVAGLEASNEAVEWARKNFRRTHRRLSGQRESELPLTGIFKAADLISPEAPNIAKLLPKNGNWQVIVDPPRVGLSVGLQKAIVGLRPQQIIHCVCNADLLFEQAKHWTTMGYRISKMAVFDMFSGTDHLEVALLLKPR